MNCIQELPGSNLDCCAYLSAGFNYFPHSAETFSGTVHCHFITHYFQLMFMFYIIGRIRKTVIRTGGVQAWIGKVHLSKVSHLESVHRQRLPYNLVCQARLITERKQEGERGVIMEDRLCNLMYTEKLIKHGSRDSRILNTAETQSLISISHCCASWLWFVTAR
jgi:hypothetical protein